MLRVIARNRLGNTTEDITYIPSGTFAQHVIVMDAYDVLAVPVGAKDIGLPKKLFSVLGLGIQLAPRGIAYVESEDLLVINDISQRSTLFLADIQGNPKGTRSIEYPRGFMPQHLEGLTTLRRSATEEQLVLSALLLNPSIAARLEVLSLVDKSTYRVVNEIFPQDPVGTEFVSGVTAQALRLPSRAPQQFLVSFGNVIQRIDVNGGLIGNPVELEAAFIEGLTQAGNTFFAADAFEGVLFALDQNLNRVPQLDRKYKIGLGLGNPVGLAWNDSTQQHLLLSFSVDLAGGTQIASLPPSLDSAARLVDLTALGFNRGRRMTYLPKEKLIAVAHLNDPPLILLFNNEGELVERIAPGVAGSPLAIAYIPTTDQFAVRFNEEPQILFILTRQGESVRTIDLTRSGVRGVASLTFFNPEHPSGGQFLIVDGQPPGAEFTYLAFVTDFNGVALEKIDFREELGVLTPGDVSTITSGENAGAFAIVDRTSNELVVFELGSGIDGKG